MRIFEIIFSPTGGTQKCADIFTAAFGKEVELIDLADFSYDFTATDITSEDICIIAAPAFGGRIPEVAANRLKLIKGNGAKAILMAVYGNREFDDCLVELQDIASENGFVPVAGVGAIAEHSLIRKFGAGRPDASDIEELNTFASRIIEKLNDGITHVDLIYDGILMEVLEELGTMPLPPYIHEKLDEQGRYQTVYAKIYGSAAAPTAGLHFTPELLRELEEMGVIIVDVLLHVGLGTFRPVKVEDVKTHHMHSEYYEVSKRASEIINEAKREGRRVIAVGTTSVRTLESVADENGFLCESKGDTDIFIYPGYRFKCVDGLITNFHLPKSTLLMLVSAFSSKEKALELYNLAVEEKYRFFSFGDACLFL